MKKLLILLLFSLLLSMSACSSTTVSGLENFDPADCSLELSRDLFPDEDFLTSFAYLDGDYALACDDGLDSSACTAFAWLRYPPEIYEHAKQHCLDTLELCERHQFTYAGFQFKERLSHFVQEDAGGLAAGCRYPEWFNMVGYCDASCTLVFLGYYNTDSKENELAQSDFAAFLENVYSPYYDFHNAQTTAP